MTLTDFDAAAFLRDYWQKRPLLIRDPWAAWANPLDPDDLAGLACADGIDSRLVTGSGGEWAVEHGPLPEARFADLGERDWTLLVQSVDHHVPEVAALIEPFRFIPNWRIDDVMVSYATDGGGVGPHHDRYDVFLVQGLGQRRWQLGAACDAATPLMPHDDLRILADFQPTEEHLLGPGDILYVPPGVAHHGVAVGADCMTYSIGFRAPTRGELIGHWAEDLIAELSNDDRYADPDLPPQSDPGEIATAALDRLHAMVVERLTDRDAFARWFGRYITGSTEGFEPVKLSERTLSARLAKRLPLFRNPASRFSYIRHGADAATLFVDGTAFATTLALAQALCARPRIDPRPDWAAPPTQAIIAALVEQGSIAFTPS